MSFETLELLVYPLFFVSLIFSVYAQIKVSSTFRKYSKVPAAPGLSGEKLARIMLAENGIDDVMIGRISGHLTDNYNPRNKVLSLSDSTVMSPSAAAVGVAAHEVGHAIQHHVGYFPIKLRGMLVPVTNFASRASWLVITAGLLLTAFAANSPFGYYILCAGVGLFAVTMLFQLVTLPCEFNASARAMKYLRGSLFV